MNLKEYLQQLRAGRTFKICGEQIGQEQQSGNRHRDKAD